MAVGEGESAAGVAGVAGVEGWSAKFHAWVMREEPRLRLVPKSHEDAGAGAEYG